MERRRDALHALMPVVYDDLRRIAAGYMRREPSGHPLQPTALVSEVYLRLIDQQRVKWRNRAHFFGVAAGMMRRILVDHARQRRAEKRGGGWERVTLTGADFEQDGPNPIDVLALHESLEKLAAFDPQQERIVELRYFGGLTIERPRKSSACPTRRSCVTGPSPRPGSGPICLAGQSEQPWRSWPPAGLRAVSVRRARGGLRPRLCEPHFGGRIRHRITCPG